MVLLTIINQTTEQKAAPFWRAQQPMSGSLIPAGTEVLGLPFPFSRRLLGESTGMGEAQHGNNNGERRRERLRAPGAGDRDPSGAGTDLQGRCSGIRRARLEGEPAGGEGAGEHRDKLDSRDSRNGRDSREDRSSTIPTAPALPRRSRPPPSPQSAGPGRPLLALRPQPA